MNATSHTLLEMLKLAAPAQARAVFHAAVSEAHSDRFDETALGFDPFLHVPAAMRVAFYLHLAECCAQSLDDHTPLPVDDAKRDMHLAGMLEEITGIRKLSTYNVAAFSIMRWLLGRAHYFLEAEMEADDPTCATFALRLLALAKRTGDPELNEYYARAIAGLLAPCRDDDATWRHDPEAGDAERTRHYNAALRSPLDAYETPPDGPPYMGKPYFFQIPGLPHTRYVVLSEHPVYGGDNTACRRAASRELPDEDELSGNFRCVGCGVIGMNTSCFKSMQAISGRAFALTADLCIPCFGPHKKAAA